MADSDETRLALVERSVQQLERLIDRVERESKERDSKTDKALWLVAGAVVMGVLNALLKSIGLG